MSHYTVKRKKKRYTVEATTRSKAKYQAYLEYREKAKRPMSFFQFFTAVSRVRKNVE